MDFGVGNYSFAPIEKLLASRLAFRNAIEDKDHPSFYSIVPSSGIHYVFTKPASAGHDSENCRFRNKH